MRVIVVGLGVQGKKRQRIAGEWCIATVDPVVNEADYSDVRDVPLSDYDAALLCVPDANKYGLIKYLVGHRKHVLVEKPLLFTNFEQFTEVEQMARDSETLLYTAYNHRFEPSIVEPKKLSLRARWGGCIDVTCSMGMVLRPWCEIRSGVTVVLA